MIHYKEIEINMRNFRKTAINQIWTDLDWKKTDPDKNYFKIKILQINCSFFWVIDINNKVSKWWGDMNTFNITSGGDLEVK